MTLLPFNQSQSCPKCRDFRSLDPTYHHRIFSNIEYLEYICKCGFCFRTETAASQPVKEYTNEAGTLKAYENHMTWEQKHECCTDSYSSCDKCLTKKLESLRDFIESYCNPPKPQKTKTNPIDIVEELTNQNDGR